MADRAWVEPRANVPLAPLCTLGVGGPARWYVEARSVEGVAAAARWAAERGHQMLVLGGGSNLVISDDGVDGLVVRMAIQGAEWGTGESRRVTAGAGESWDTLVASTVARGWAGIECLSGIPGSVGGTPIQNVGAYGQEVADTIRDVTVLDRATGDVTSLPAAACGFAYRTSRFKSVDRDRFVVCAVTFELGGVPAAPAYPDVVRALAEAGIVSPSVSQLRETVMAIRRRKGMVLDADDSDSRSVGSFFTNPIVSADVFQSLGTAAGVPATGFVQPGGRTKLSAAWLIQHSGFRCGLHDGAAGISQKHVLALINRGGASARDILRLAVRIKRAVYERFGILLVMEPVCVGFEHDEDVDYLRKAED